MINRGDVFYCPQYELGDETKHDTWFVVLCGGTPWETCLCLKSTTKSRRYLPVVPGCNVDSGRLYRCFYIPLAWSTCFTEDSYLVLPEIHEISLSKILQLRETNCLVQKGTLQNFQIQVILNCVKKCEEDIAIRHWQRLSA